MPKVQESFVGSSKDDCIFFIALLQQVSQDVMYKKMSLKRKGEMLVHVYSQNAGLLFFTLLFILYIIKLNDSR